MSELIEKYNAWSKCDTENHNLRRKLWKEYCEVRDNKKYSDLGDFFSEFEPNEQTNRIKIV